MVLFFTSNVVTPEHTIYMGEHKEENEDLIKWGWPEDVWFHVDKLSSAHVYLRLLPGETIDTISPALLQDCVQLVKANSIEGNKKNDLSVVYTPWSNLKKTNGMAVGQVGFHSQKEVKTTMVVKRINEIVNRLNKTMQKLKPDLQAEKEERDRKERDAQKAERREEEKRRRLEEEQRKKEAESRVYTFLKPQNMTSNYEPIDESDFM